MSYLQHFSLSEQPFRLTPDPEFVYWSKQHARAKAYMESTIWLADGFVVITGEIGSGKTTLLQAFLGELDDSVTYAVVSQTQLTPTQFLQAVLTEFGFKPFKKRKVELLDMLNMYLIEQYSEGKKVLLIVDEAQNLSKSVLEEIRMLSGIETHKEKVLRIVLAGQPELRDKLESPKLKQLIQRVRLKFHIGPLSLREMHEYIDHRLEVAGHSAQDLFAEECFAAIFQYTGGVPRLINTLCDTALLCAFADEKSSLTVADIEAAIEELGWQDKPPVKAERVKELPDVPELPPMPHLVPVSRAKPLYRVVIREDGKTISEHEIGPGRVVIGRAPDNEIYIKSRFVSRHHAQIVSDEQQSYVQDLNSTNGIFMGKRRVKKHVLQDGDVVSVGVHELIYTELRGATDVAGDESESDSDAAEDNPDDDRERAANDGSA
ncbi:MAG: AAA family ATPase [Woeseia sp.]|nr:AAA family ATPase [Woeseia sp.]MBT8097308.1 AAA family ATPase [Woeseia sp.]NNE62255.1 AAA family ATPase [Woeseia sp.]NNL54451.1 AAA family ATPase [Woeseia sp.]